MTSSESQRRAGRAGRRDRSHQDSGRCGMTLQVLLHDQAAHGMPDQDRRCGGLGRGRVDIVDIVGDPVPQTLRGPVVPAQLGYAHVMAGRPQPIAEVTPAPAAMPRAVYEQNRGHAMRLVRMPAPLSGGFVCQVRSGEDVDTTGPVRLVTLWFAWALWYFTTY